MGPVRRGLIRAALLAASLPNAAWAQGAQVCDQQRPGWDGTPVSGLDEALQLMASPLSLIAIGATLLALRFRSQWGGVAVVVLWTGLVSMITMFDPTGTRTPGMAEGCIGTPTLFIAAVAAICVATIIYTAPRSGGG